MMEKATLTIQSSKKLSTSTLNSINKELQKGLDKAYKIINGNKCEYIQKFNQKVKSTVFLLFLINFNIYQHIFLNSIGFKGFLILCLILYFCFLLKFFASVNKFLEKLFS